MRLDNNHEAFLKLLSAGLWGSTARFSYTEEIDWNTIYRLSVDQSVTGLVLAGLEHSDVKPSQVLLLQWIGEVQIIEQQNKALNEFVAKLIEKLRAADVYAILVKGQGIAQCYEHPLWRLSGDVDLLLSKENYEKTKDYLQPLASSIDKEDVGKMHLGMTIDSWIIELHGALPFGISSKVDKVINKVQKDVFYNGNVRSWQCGKTQVFLPSPNNDVIFVFTHFLHHFFIEGVGLRQICDWCRLLWSYKDSIDKDLLERRLRDARLMSEWKAFAALSVDWLGMPVEAMPFYDARFNIKGEKVLKRVLKCGNFGHNNDLSYRTRYKGLSYKIVAVWRRFADFASLVPVFPVDAPKFFFTYLFQKAF